MKISFDRKEYLSVSSVFENESLDDVDDELSEFNDDATDMAYELAYTRYALAKTEASYHALREAVAWERSAMRVFNGSCMPSAGYGEFVWAADNLAKARAKVDRLMGGE